MEYAAKNIMNEDLLIKREIKVFDFTDVDFIIQLLQKKIKNLFQRLLLIIMIGVLFIKRMDV